MALEVGLSLLAKPQPSNEVPNLTDEILSTIIINRCNPDKSWRSNSITYPNNHII
jgi:hypothetical protein